MMILNPYRFAAPLVDAAKWDSTYNTGGVNYLAGDLQVTPKNSSHQNARSNRTIVGKVYFEVLINGVGQQGTPTVGVAAAMGVNAAVGEDATSWGYRIAAGFGIYRNNATSIGGKPTLTAGQTAMIAVDMAAGKIWFGKDGVWNEGDPAAGTGAPYSNLSGTLYAAVGLEGLAQADVLARFSSADWAFSAPAGFSAI